MEEKVRRLEERLMRLASAERKSISGNLFQNPAGPDYKVRACSENQPPHRQDQRRR